jgi:hypothetical protein
VQPFVSGPNLELDFLAFGERLVAVTLDVGEVHEDVAAAFLRDETIPLLVVEPFNFPTLLHATSIPP